MTLTAVASQLTQWNARFTPEAERRAALKRLSALFIQLSRPERFCVLDLSVVAELLHQWPSENTFPLLDTVRLCFSKTETCAAVPVMLFDALQDVLKVTLIMRDYYARGLWHLTDNHS